MFRENKKSEELARAYLWLQKMNKIIAVLAILINSTLFLLMLKDWNLGMIVFIPNLWVCFLLYWKINRERIEKKKKELIRRD